MAFTSAPWRHNFTDGIPVTVTHRGQEYHTTGTLVPMSPEAMGVAVRKSLDTGGSAQRMGIRTAGDHQPTAAELAESNAYGLLSDGKYWIARRSRRAAPSQMVSAADVALSRHVIDGGETRISTPSAATP